MRAVINENGTILQQADYYPFGTAFAFANTIKNKYLYGGKEYQDETIGATQFSQYDFEARLMDTRIPRFTSLEPLIEKYRSISPYAYCANNPVNVIDPDGRDIIVLNNPKGAMGFGHSAALIGNDKAGWTFISKEGRDDAAGGSAISGGPVSTPLDDGYSTLKEFREEQAKNKNLAGYTEDVRFLTSEEQDKTAISAMRESANSNYHFMLSNCVDAVSDALKAVGLDPGYATYQSNNPRSGFHMRVLPPEPNIRFMEIKKNNADRIIPTELDVHTREKKVDSMSIVMQWITQNPNIKIYVLY